MIGPRAERRGRSAGGRARERRGRAPLPRVPRLAPHFLLNSLHLVGVSLRTEGPDATLRVLEDLGGLLRHVVDADRRPLVPLREEVAFVERCVAVERARMGTAIELSVHAGEDALDAPVPSLVLQPLVENALRHGLRAGGGAGAVEVRAFRADSFLHVAVLDDGPGLPDGWDLARDAGCGLQAVEALLDRHGTRADLIVENRVSGTGAEARIRLEPEPSSSVTAAGSNRPTAKGPGSTR